MINSEPDMAIWQSLAKNSRVLQSKTWQIFCQVLYSSYEAILIFLFNTVSYNGGRPID